jgi:hypothetical protein
MAKLVVNSESLVSVADAIREKGGTNASLEFPQGFVNGINAIESGGGSTEEIEAIIDESGVLGTTDGSVTEKVEQLIDKAEVAEDWYNHFSNTFCTANPNMGAVFKGYTGTKLPKFDVSKYKTIEGLCYNAKNLEIIDFYLDYNGNSIYQLCQNTPKLKYIKGVNTSNTTFVSNAFYTSGVEEIEMPFDFSKVTTANKFVDEAKNLREIRFVPETIKISITIPSPVLSIGNVFDLTDTENVGSVQSIINGLATLAEGAAAQTLTLSKNLPLTAEQKQAITTAVNNKGWTLAFA